MGLTQHISRRRCFDITIVVTDTSFPAATIDVTTGTTLNISIGTGNEVVVEIVFEYLILIIHRTSGSGSIDILIHLSAKQADEGGTMDITRIGGVSITLSATVCIGSTQRTIIHIAADPCTLLDQNVGVVFLAIVFGNGKSVIQTCICIAVQAKINGDRLCLFCHFSLPGIHRLRAHHATELSTAIDLIDLSGVVQVHLRIL